MVWAVRTPISSDRIKALLVFMHNINNNNNNNNSKNNNNNNCVFI